MTRGENAARVEAVVISAHVSRSLSDKGERRGDVNMTPRSRMRRENGLKSDGGERRK